jgi:hypothetical protein
MRDSTRTSDGSSVPPIRGTFEEAWRDGYAQALRDVEALGFRRDGVRGLVFTLDALRLFGEWFRDPRAVARLAWIRETRAYRESAL